MTLRPLHHADRLLINGVDHEFLAIVGDRLVVELGLEQDLRARARAIYNTGDRAQSIQCITEHLTRPQRNELRLASKMACPTCGHLLKDRSLR